jgi:hypothetical protein
MTAENLAVVFAPGLMTSNGSEMSVELMQMENKKRVVISRSGKNGLGLNKSFLTSKCWLASLHVCD